MKNWQRGYTATELLILVAGILALVGIIGWMMNIVDLAHMNLAHITGMFVLRVIGIFIPPLGAVLGFV